MARLARFFVAVSLLATLWGCTAYTRAPKATVWWAYPHAHEPTLTQTSQEHSQAAYKVAYRDARALVDDFDLLFMTDRPTRLTRWHDR